MGCGILTDLGGLTQFLVRRRAGLKLVIIGRVVAAV